MRQPTRCASSNGGQGVWRRLGRPCWGAAVPAAWCNSSCRARFWRPVAACLGMPLQQRACGCWRRCWPPSGSSRRSRRSCCCGLLASSCGRQGGGQQRESSASQVRCRSLPPGASSSLLLAQDAGQYLPAPPTSVSEVESSSPTCTPYCSYLPACPPACLQGLAASTPPSVRRKRRPPAARCCCCRRSCWGSCRGSTTLSSMSCRGRILRGAQVCGAAGALCCPALPLHCCWQLAPCARMPRCNTVPSHGMHPFCRATAVAGAAHFRQQPPGSAAAARGVCPADGCPAAPGTARGGGQRCRGGRWVGIWKSDWLVA